VKLRSAVLVILLIILADQALKIWVKTHMPLSHPWDSFYHNPFSPYDSGIKVFGNKFQIYFVENEGMAWGWKFGGTLGKMALTLFRLAAVVFGVIYLRSIIQKKYHRGFIVCACLIFAGALGNLIDSMFYGLLFEESTYDHVAKFLPAHGYTSFLHGRVVDMLYFPLVKTHFPAWMPFIGGEEFEFFSPVFNIADASISVGVLTILFFQKKFLRRYPDPTQKAPEPPDSSLGGNEVQVSS
jgi:signal peptidase II